MAPSSPGPARLLLPFALLAAGCSDRPTAPPLVNEAVYRNEAVGVRFLAPEGWSVVSRADPPAGQLPRPVVLVSYMHSQGEKPAEFELVAADVPEGDDPGRFLAGHRIGGEKWAVKGPPEQVTVGGLPATRYVMTRRAGKDEYRREATAVRRGGRVYFFVVSFGAADPERRDQARRCVESVTWTK